MAWIAVDVCLAYVNTWRIFGAWWGQQWDKHAELTKSLGALFQSIDVAANLVLNVIALQVMHLMLIYAAGFSADFLRFSMACIVLPSLLGSCAYIYYRYGARMWAAIPGALLGWLRNWMLVTAIAMVCWTQTAIIYAVLLRLEPFLPSSLQGPLTFPVSVVEKAFMDCTLGFNVITLLLLLSLPVWTHAYRLNMNLVGRKSDLNSVDTFLEIVYFGSTSMAVYQLCIPMAALQARFGAPFHIIHVLFGAVEVLLINQLTQYKFALLHKLAHDIQPLYRMVHMEHHICKGIFPNTSAAGLLEFWFLGGNLTFGAPAIYNFPYLHFTMVYCGANVLVHTMWPSKRFAQWHTLHHIVQADVYNVNIPSDNDRMFSKDISKYETALSKESLFVQMPWLSDAASALLMTVAMAGLHYCLGWSLFAVWHTIQW